MAATAGRAILATRAAGDVQTGLMAAAAHPVRAVRGLPWRTPWPWWLLMGLGQAAASLVVCLVALTRVLLPYDEAFLGMDRAALDAVNPRLVDYMAHDRVSFGITTLALGIMYAGLSWAAMRREAPWARLAIPASAIPGFMGFFLFLRFDYFDPLHAIVWATLLGLFIAGLARLRHDAAEGRFPPAPARADSPRQRAGRAAMLLVGIGLTGAGIVIATIGSSDVFIATDLEFMQTTAEELEAANPRIRQVVAHDRAGFGGALLAQGILVLLTTWWSLPGTRWAWGTTVLAGAVGYAGAIGIHLAVGYDSIVHMAPAYAGLTLFLVASWLLRPTVATRRPAGAGRPS